MWPGNISLNQVRDKRIRDIEKKKKKDKKDTDRERKRQIEETDLGMWSSNT